MFLRLAEQVFSFVGCSDKACPASLDCLDEMLFLGDWNTCRCMACEDFGGTQVCVDS